MGWFPRLHTGPPWRYHAKLATLLVHGRYSIILTKGAFLHAAYLEAYRQLPPAVHAMVDRMHNCEDLAMQFLVANTTMQPPVFVHAQRLWDYGQGQHAVAGISSNTSAHHEQRAACLEELVKVFGMPLRSRSLRWWHRLLPVTYKNVPMRGTSAVQAFLSD